VDSERLKSLWLKYRNTAGAWLTDAVGDMNLTTEEHYYISDLEDSVRVDKETEYKWRRDYQARVQDFKNEMGDWGKGRRKEYVVRQIRGLQAHIEGVHKEYKEMVASGKDISDRAFFLLLSDIPGLEKQIKKLSIELKAKPSGGRVTEAMIERARARDIREFAEAKRDYILCPAHDDKKPSMWVKNGFGHCFSCGATLDCIGYLMKTKDMKFEAAVEALQ